MTTRYPEPLLSDAAPQGTLTIWDSADAPPNDAGVYTWEGHADRGSVRALLGYVERDGERLRAKYSAWIHDLGETRFGGRRLIDHLVVEDGLSAWWMTLFVDQSPWLSPSIIDVLRLFALEEIVATQRPGALVLVSSNRSLDEILADWCSRRDIAYRWRRSPVTRSAPTLHRAYRALPHSVQAVVDLARFLRGRWPLRKADRSQWFGGPEAVLLCSPFFNVDQEQARARHFHSRYWEGLHALLRNMQLNPNWLHSYQPHDAVPDPGVALEWVRGFNGRRAEEGFHSFVEANLSWAVVRRAVARWLRLGFRTANIGGIERAFRRADSQMWLWPLVRGDWEKSTRGSVALFNQLLVLLFDKALAGVPHQPQGLYLFENQAWERALVHAWRKHGHGRLTGVAHSTIRFWDLRYFMDPRTRRAVDAAGMPQPDLIALNGQLAVDACRDWGVPGDSIVACEALRFGYLNSLEARRPGKRLQEDVVRVLILGDYLASGTTRMLNLLLETRLQPDVATTFTVKSHPRHPVNPADYAGLRLQVVAAPLGEIISEFDVAYSSNMTAAAIDAYLAGLPVIVMLEEQELNFSPLRKLPGVRFVSRPEELAAALRPDYDAVTESPDRDAFLFLDPNLPRWKELLTSGRSHATTIGDPRNTHASE